MMEHIHTDICVIGGGSGGLSVASGAAQMGARVVLFEADQMGGDCLNSGCVPSKALLAAAKAAHYTTGNPDMGISGAPANVDFAAVKAHVAAVIAGIAPHDSVERFSGLGVRVIEEHARFAGPRVVRSASYEVTAKFIVIATGSKAAIPPIPGLDSVPFHTNETIFADTDKPSHLAIIGGGPIGIEMAQAHRRLGCAVTVIEAAHILGRDDPELAGLVTARLATEGIRLIEEIGVREVSKNTDTGDGADAITITLANGTYITASHLLVATGRTPSGGDLDLEAAGIRTERGAIVTDRRLRTSCKRVFAIGDVTGRAPFTHMAGYHAGIVIRNMLFRLPAKIDDRLTPWVTYTDPELAHVGMAEGAASAAYGAANIRVERVPLTGNDRARAEGRTKGMVKVITHRDGQILGAGIVAPAAGEMIMAWSLAIARRQKIAAMASTIAPYPTYGDASKRAAGQFFTERLFSPRTRALVRLLLKL
ncbi:MAG: FAD-dependent oxidoreductase [Alphaproteobacteria bacterium]|nr:FAD-dependent oxidoreductase [Alphaproteobacteria bacterium]